jgi:hypothetical protein
MHTDFSFVLSSSFSRFLLVAMFFYLTKTLVEISFAHSLFFLALKNTTTEWLIFFFFFLSDITQPTQSYNKKKKKRSLGRVKNKFTAKW